MGPVGFSETSVNDYQSTLRNIPEERRYSNTLFYVEGLLGCHQPPRLEALATAVLACLFKIFVATHHIYRPSWCVCVRVRACVRARARARNLTYEDEVKGRAWAEGLRKWAAERDVWT